MKQDDVRIPYTIEDYANSIYEKRVVGFNHVQYLIDESNKFYNELSGSTKYDYEKHRYVKWVNAPEYNNLIFETNNKMTYDQIREKHNRSFACDCCLKIIPDDEHRISYNSSSNSIWEEGTQYKVCFECHDKLQKMPHTSILVSESIEKIQADLIATGPQHIEKTDEINKSDEINKNALKKEINRIIEETLDRIKDPSWWSQAFPVIKNEPKIEQVGPSKQKQEDWREAWYNRYDKE
jgi:hypothetical protein